jgi:membrane-associated protease RseP (regulator of RpoE activity)
VRGIGSSAVGIGKLFSPGGISSYVDTVANKPSSSTGPVACTSGGVENRPSSIIGITQGVSDAARNGLNDFLLLFVGVNIAIGVFNLLPMLPFDGGHVVIATYERLRERRGKRYHADVAKLLPVVYGLVGVLLILMLSAGYLDVTRGVN